MIIESKQFRYKLDGRGNPFVCLCTLRVGDKFFYGIAKCHKGDRFEKRKGRMIAEGRAQVAIDVMLNGEMRSLNMDKCGFVHEKTLDMFLDVFYS